MMMLRALQGRAGLGSGFRERGLMLCAAEFRARAGRRSSQTHAASNGQGEPELSSEMVEMTFVEEDGTECPVVGKVGQTLLELAHENDVQLEGACGGDLACSTCHVILPKEFYDILPPKQEEEEDMLDLAWGLTETSRLGCQIKITQQLKGMLIRIPPDSLDLSK
jgi:ferredoxin